MAVGIPWNRALRRAYEGRKNVGIIFMTPFRKERFEKRDSKPELPSPQHVTRFVILLPLTCWRMVMISGRFKSCSGIPT